MADDPIVRDKVARLKIGIEGLRLGAIRVAHLDHEGRHARSRGLDREASMVLHQPGHDRAGGRDRRPRDAAPRTPTWAYRFLRSRANSIEGGTSDVLKNIVAERVLGSAEAAMSNYRHMLPSHLKVLKG